jgi:hypothetical protein
MDMFGKWRAPDKPQQPVKYEGEKPTDTAARRAQFAGAVTEFAHNGRIKHAFDLIDSARTAAEFKGQSTNVDEQGEAFDEIIFLNELEKEVKKVESLGERAEAA